MIFRAHLRRKYRSIYVKPRTDHHRLGIVSSHVQLLTSRRLISHYFTVYSAAMVQRGLSVRVPGCQKLQMTAWPGLAQDAL